MANYEWWSTPITDRTQDDITFKTPKAYLNASDMNRIEGNIGILAKGFNLSVTTHKWEIGEFLRQGNMVRIINNTDVVKKAFNLNSEPYSTMLHWNDLNIIERLLQMARDVFLILIDWDCFECQFDTWDSFENSIISWDYFEKQLGCHNTKTWIWFDDEFSDWDNFELNVDTWNYFECPNKGGA